MTHFEQKQCVKTHKQYCTHGLDINSQTDYMLKIKYIYSVISKKFELQTHNFGVFYLLPLISQTKIIYKAINSIHCGYFEFTKFSEGC